MLNMTNQKLITNLRNNVTQLWQEACSEHAHK